MQIEFSAKVNTTKVTDMSTGVHASVVLSTRLFEIDSLDEFYAFMPEPGLDLSLRLGDKPVAQFRCEIKNTREVTSKDGTFSYVTFSGAITSEFYELQKLVGQEVNVVMMGVEDDQMELEE